MIEAVIFDNDGILVDSEPVWDQARRTLAAKVGKIWDRDDHLAVMGTSTEEWALYMVQRMELDMTVAEVIETIIGYVNATYEKQVPFMSGAVAAVEYAYERFPIAVASGSPPALIETVTHSPELNGKFKAIVAADNIGVGKPEPDVYLVTAAELGVAPANCLCLEDSGNGILSAVRAGMQVIAVPDHRFPPKSELLAQAHHVLDSLHDFPALLDQLTP